MDTTANNLKFIERLAEQLMDSSADIGIKLLACVAIFIVGKIIIGMILKFLTKSEEKGHLDTTIARFLHNALKMCMYVLLAVLIISTMGVPMASIIAVIASCGVAVGLALQGALSNLAGGIMLLIFHPFKVGDYIIASGNEGTVKALTLFYTELTTVDNQKVMIPNGTLMNANVVNTTAEENRRVDLTFQVSMETPMEEVEELLHSVIAADSRVFSEPAPVAAPLKRVQGGMEYVIRLWVKTTDYWDVYMHMTREINLEMAARGFKEPAPVSAVQVTRASEASEQK